MRDYRHNRYFKEGLMIFLAGAAIILFYFFVKYFGDVREAFGKFVNILQPFIMGFVMAYLLCPSYNWTVRHVYALLKDRMKKKHQALLVARVVGSVVALVILFAVVFGVLWLLVPQIAKSIVGLVEVIPGRIDDLTVFLDKVLKKNGHPEIAKKINEIINEGTDTLLSYAENVLLSGKGDLISKISQSVISIVGSIFDFIVGILAAMYMLNGKERFMAQLKKMIAARFSDARANAIYDFGHYTNRTFGGFINGKIIDSIIIGFICYFGLVLMKMPYKELISLIIGVTNIIPFFGPFIGAIPSAILICIVDPLKALYFLIFIFVLQQFDGNILGPKILGGSVGIASFWVMFSIILCGGLFGVLGMVLGVPVFAILTYYLDRRVGIQLVRRGRSTETFDYANYEKYGIDDKEEIRNTKHGGF